MKYVDLLMVAIIIIYIVDISGFTESWRAALAKWLKVSSLKPLPPFDCGKCATWWVCIIYSLCAGTFSLHTLLFIAALSLLSVPIGNFLIFIYDAMIALINVMRRLYD